MTHISSTHTYCIIYKSLVMWSYNSTVKVWFNLGRKSQETSASVYCNIISHQVLNLRQPRFRSETSSSHRWFGDFQVKSWEIEQSFWRLVSKMTHFNTTDRTTLFMYVRTLWCDKSTLRVWFNLYIYNTVTVASAAFQWLFKHVVIDQLHSFQPNSAIFNIIKPGNH